MLIKVCGMRWQQQVTHIDGLVEYIGFIFYEKSQRFVTSTPIVNDAFKVGVFVNAPFDEISNLINEHSLDAVQLHGHETPEFCSQFTSDISVIKAFGVDEQFNFDTTTDYEEHVDYFLFDTKTANHGGSGKQFDWSVLSNYSGETPFLLSGGIHPDSVSELKIFQHPNFVGIDLNSGFEHSPGDKDITKLKHFIEQIKN